MFDSIKAMGALAGLMKNKVAVAAALERLRVELAARRITVEGAKQGDGSPGITVVVSGKMEVISIAVAPALLAAAQEEAGRARLQGLVAGAVNAALKRAKEVVAQEMRAEAQKLGLPDIPGLGDMLGG